MAIQATTGEHPMLGYCTNVHAGATFHQTLTNLREHAVAVKTIVSPTDPMGVGLWLSAQAARELIETQRVADLRRFLDEHGLIAFTLNGFPYGDFHQRVVKHKVYEPDWRSAARLNYTLDLVHILGKLLPDGVEGSISTLPLGWPRLMGATDDAGTEAAHRAAADRLLDLMHHLARSELQTGKLIHVDIEPEPGCLLDTGDDVIRFFGRYLLNNADAHSVRAYLRICHDICHAAVMFEDQAQLLRRYEQAGLQVGKVQVSSAVRVDFETMDGATRREAAAQLRSFAEDRYLHQTMVRRSDGVMRFYEDLPAALAGEMTADDPEPRGVWRVHFHVPIYLEEFGHIGTTRGMIDQCLPIARAMGVRHFEAETYAWNVLPAALRVDRLADGIAKEMTWLSERMTGNGAT